MLQSKVHKKIVSFEKSMSCFGHLEGAPWGSIDKEKHKKLGELALEFFLFTTDLTLALKAERAGIDSIMVDWETRGKADRQKGKNLELNCDTPEDLRRLSSILRIPVSVRINPLGSNTPSEIKDALKNGAKMIMLPMASSLKEVKSFLSIVDKRAKTIVQIETPSLVKQIGKFKDLDWDYAYIGLNDLMVASGRHSIWEAISDGTAEAICKKLADRKYGFGGSTVLGGGDPIMGDLILHELVRLGGCMSIMRRTFKRELLDRDFDAEIKALRSFIKCSEKRGAEARLYDHNRLLQAIRQLI
jgi:hypothetical protein